MFVGTQFTGPVAAGASHTWFTYNWSPDWHVIWTVVPLTPVAGAPQVEWSVAVQRAGTSAITYWITIHNLTSAAIDVEARYEVLD